MLRKGVWYLVTGWLIVMPLAAFPDPLQNNSVLAVAEKLQIIQARIQLYNRSFPNIAFVHAGGGRQWRTDYIEIERLLGETPVSLDYQHPPQLAADLMAVSRRRLALVLQEDLVSASLFGTDKGGPLQGMPLCVITLNPHTQVEDNLAATRYMLDLPESVLATIHPGRLLDPRDHLIFSLDHEAFHCLDSAMLGGAPMTKQSYGGDYNLYRREHSADAFALATYRQRRTSTATYGQNIVLVRALWFLSDGPCYDTYVSLREILMLPASELDDKSLADLFHLAKSVRDRNVPSYESFLDRQAMVLRAASQLGFQAHLYGQQWPEVMFRDTNRHQVENTVKRYRYLYRRLFDDAPIEFEQVDGQQ